MMAELHFIRPWWLLALLPLALLLWGLLRRPRQASAWRNICDPKLLAALEIDGGQRRYGPWLLLAAGWLLATLALAGPAWTMLEQPVYQGVQARVLVLDLSLSMDTTDIGPSRLARARFKTLDLLERSRDGQTALIVFANDAYALSPLTDDANTLAALVPTLTTALMPGQGSELGKALGLAEELLTRANVPAGEIIVIGDGVARLDSAVATAERLERRGTVVSVLGVGTPAGAPVPLATGGFLHDADGAIVIPGLERARLQTVARAGDGRYIDITADDTDVNTLLDTGSNAMLDQLEQTLLTSGQWREEGIWLVLALLPMAAFAFRRGGLLGCVLIAVLLPPPAQAIDWPAWWSRADQRGEALLKQGEPAAAAEHFIDPAWRGAAYYRSGQYQLAADSFARLDTPTAHYNRGNALAQTGDLEAAIEAYGQTLTGAPGHTDATFNKALLERMLKQQRQANNNSEASAGQPTADQASQPQTNLSNAPPATDSQSDQPGAGQQVSPSSSSGQSSVSQGSTQVNAATQTPQSDPQNVDEPDAESTSSSQPASVPGDNTPATELNSTAPDNPSKESTQSVQQWLRRIPDDPGGLLQQKFLREHQRRQRDGEQQHSEVPW